MDRIEADYQPGIVASASSHALFITLNRASPIDSQQSLAAAKTKLLGIIAGLPERLKSQQAIYPDAQLHLNVGLSSKLWDYLEILPKPPNLQPFKAIANKNLSMPATDADLLLHIRSNRHDLNHHLSQILFAELLPLLTIDEMVHGFCYLDSRDLTGFVDGTENPEGEHRKAVALISDDRDFNGGSYVHIQKYVHDLARWQQLSTTEQEESYGRSKADNIEFPSSDKSSRAHTSRAVVKNKERQNIEILRQSLPFATQASQGLMFASYAAKSDSFDLMLASMCDIDPHGHSDAILNISRAESGHVFFAPPLSWFKRLTRSL